MGRLTDEVRREPPWTMLFIDDIVICRDQGRSGAKTRILEICMGKKRNEGRSKTKYLCINEGNDNETVKMEDTKVPRLKEFKYLGLMVQESGSCKREVKKRVQAGWNG